MKIYDIHQQLPDELSRISEDQFQLQVREHSFDEIGKSSSAGFYRDALRRLRQNKASVVSFWIILSIIIDATCFLRLKSAFCQLRERSVTYLMSGASFFSSSIFS